MRVFCLTIQLLPTTTERNRKSKIKVSCFPRYLLLKVIAIYEGKKCVFLYVKLILFIYYLGFFLTTYLFYFSPNKYFFFFTNLNAISLCNFLFIILLHGISLKYTHMKTFLWINSLYCLRLKFIKLNLIMWNYITITIFKKGNISKLKLL